jgi:hypothetical protein
MTILRIIMDSQQLMAAAVLPHLTFEVIKQTEMFRRSPDYHRTVARVQVPRYGCTRPVYEIHFAHRRLRKPAEELLQRSITSAQAALHHRLRTGFGAPRYPRVPGSMCRLIAADIYGR